MNWDTYTQPVLFGAFSIDMEAFSLGMPGLPPPRAKTISGLIADGRLFMEAIHRYQVALGSG
jgi:hypothetical protein